MPGQLPLWRRRPQAPARRGGLALEAGLNPDWTLPWWAGWRGPAQQVLALTQQGQPGTQGLALPDALNQQIGSPCSPSPHCLPVRFVPQPPELLDGAYERHIFLRREVPTREGWHDFFNGLCWLRFPQTKQCLNRLQAEAVAATLAQQGGLQGRRGPLRDALTLFDENAALLQAPEPLWQALLARDWDRLFITLRPLWAQARLVLFGHALLEKLVQPYPSITAHVLCAPIPAELAPEPEDGPRTKVGAHMTSDLKPHPWDGWLAERLSAQPQWLAGQPAKPFTPLPVLGVPGWWPANENPSFYADQTVFRPPRSARSASAARQPGAAASTAGKNPPRNTLGA